MSEKLIRSSKEQVLGVFRQVSTNFLGNACTEKLKDTMEDRLALS